MSRIKVVLGYGLGVDSTAILLRWIFEPGTRPCELDELLVITAMTGDEWPRSGELVSEHILPLLREYGIRYMQVARHGAHKADGITILSDTGAPFRLFIEGDYKLSQEMIGNGTVPQMGGIRKCSMKSKGEVIDAVLAGLLDGAPFLHAIGFEVNELSRAIRDARYNTAQRTGFYPLVEWGWDRARCEAYITEKTGATWIKSACTFCPFALGNKAGQARVQDMFAIEAAAGLRALVMEFVSYSLNPRQALIKEAKLADLLAASGRHQVVMDLFRKALDAMPWRIYEVRRVAMPTSADPAKGVWNRSLRSIAEGTREEMLTELALLADLEDADLETGADGVTRAYLARRGETFPAHEHLYVAAPAGAQDKEPKAFRTAMTAYQEAM